MSDINLASLNATSALELFKSGQLSGEQLTKVLTGAVTRIEASEFKGNPTLTFRNASFYRGARNVSAQVVLMVLEHATEAERMAREAIKANPPKHGIKV